MISKDSKLLFAFSLNLGRFTCAMSYKWNDKTCKMELQSNIQLFIWYFITIIGLIAYFATIGLYMYNLYTIPNIPITQIVYGEIAVSLLIILNY